VKPASFPVSNTVREYNGGDFRQIIESLLNFDCFFNLQKILYELCLLNKNGKSNCSGRKDKTLIRRARMRRTSELPAHLTSYWKNNTGIINGC